MTVTKVEWLEQRRLGIGGSDIAALLGLSPWKSPYELWLDKTGKLQEQTTPEQEERMHFGNLLEDVVAGEYASRTGRKVQRINQALVHPRFPVARANLDRVVLLPNTIARWDGACVKGAEKVLEIKTASAWAEASGEWGSPGSDEIPMHYYLQVIWYLGISGLPEADLAVLFGGQKFATYKVANDPTYFEELAEVATDWWDRHVKTDTPPPPGNANDARAINKRHCAGMVATADSNIAIAVQRLKAVKENIKKCEEEEKELLDMILPAFGDAEAITHNGRTLATWKNNKDTTKTDWEAAYKSVVAALPPGHPAILPIDNFTTTRPGPRVLRLSK